MWQLSQQHWLFYAFSRWSSVSLRKKNIFNFWFHEGIRNSILVYSILQSSFVFLRMWPQHLYEISNWISRWISYQVTSEGCSNNFLLLQYGNVWLFYFLEDDATELFFTLNNIWHIWIINRSELDCYYQYNWWYLCRHWITPKTIYTIFNSHYFWEIWWPRSLRAAIYHLWTV